LKTALQFPPDLRPIQCKVAVLLILESASRPLVHGFSEFASEREVLLLPFRVVDGRVEMKDGGHGRPQITLQDIELTMKDDAAFKTASALAAARVMVIELDGRTADARATAGAKVAEANELASEEWATGDVAGLLQGWVGASRWGARLISLGKAAASSADSAPAAVAASTSGLASGGAQSQPVGTAPIARGNAPATPERQQGGPAAGEFVTDDGTHHLIPQMVGTWSSKDGAQLGEARRVKLIVLPGGLGSIGDQAFVGSTALESITIPPGVVSIGIRASQCCNSLKASRFHLAVHQSAAKRSWGAMRSRA
jgi:hypothetical protein